MRGIAGNTQTATTTPDTPDAGPDRVEDIVVTAQRRGENLQKVPIAITAITAARLEAVGVDDSRDLAVLTPGLQAPSQAGYFQPRIRGVGTSSVGPGLENPVAVYVDGVYLASSAASLFSYSGIDRIEVLKGPQGTLFGRNSTGGLIQVVTRDPKGGFEGKASATYGNYQDFIGDLYVAGGTSDAAAIDFGIRYETQGKGYGTNVALGRETNRRSDDLSLRSKLLLRPTDTLTLRLSGDYEYNKGSYPDIRT
ncbi:MAG TPA: TonB-dependent receptor plug domain-containing protein, partial [Sphingomonas sp.]|uniref:TonB-dependent receptor plug domain-containing protein n=1 Tax=Sphingomonas sp. TaxID=28214 RepID=UPI002ED9EBA7